MALFIAGTSLLYLILTKIIKTGSTQNILSSLQISTQRDCNSVEQATRDTLQLGYPGILAKTSQSRETWGYAAGVADIRTKKSIKTDFCFRIGSVTT